MVPGSKRLLHILESMLDSIHDYFERRFDRLYGVDTAGVIPLNELTIASPNIHDSIWYEPVSVKAFKQLMSALTIEVSQFVFIDFGSGKGRVLLLASGYGFKHVLGVEFAHELHQIALNNITRYERYTHQPRHIEALCMDAVNFPIPDDPLVIFFYCPFLRSVMEQVLRHIVASFARHPRDILLIFHGQNPETIALFEATGFHCREVALRADWARFTQYRGFVFSSPKASTTAGGDPRFPVDV
jgi:predicted RNA methylase